MVSPARARAWQERLRRGETIRLRAEVDAGQAPSAYLIPTAIIPGRRRDQEIVYSCHLDHPNPGANDNASGCAGILEVARTLQRLIRSGALSRPERTLRFIWPAEIEGTIALLNARPEFVRRTLATIHLDMIGGNTRDHQIDPARPRLAAKPAELRLGRRLRLRPLRQRAVADPCRRRTCRTAAGRSRGRSPRAPGRDRRLHRGQRPPGLGGRQLPDPGDLHRRLARPLHPHPARPPLQPRSHQDAPRDLHRRRFGLITRDRRRRFDAGCSGGAAARNGLGPRLSPRPARGADGGLRL